MKFTTNWKVTAKGFDYCAAPYGNVCYIPAGVAVVPATNIPTDNNPKYWVEPWPGIEHNEKAASWQRNYGFLVDSTQVTDSPYKVGQRCRIKPCGSWPATKSVRYGIIQGATQCPGMHLINEDGRESNAGEWAFLVASYAHPSAGAMWFSAAGIEPMRNIKKT